MSRVRSALVVTAIAALLGSACDSTRTVVPEEFVPVATTPPGAVQRLAWGFNNWSVEILRGLLSDDFVVKSAVLDSAGNSTHDTTLTRDSLFVILHLLFEGAPGIPRAASATLTFDRNLVPFDDTRPGKVGRWHKTIRTAMDLVVVDSTSLQPFEATGYGLFFLVRGDSASIPPEEIARGFKPDSTRWWIERWEDESISSGGGAHANGAAAPPMAAMLRSRVRRGKS